jgi:hypothetical protein
MAQVNDTADQRLHSDELILRALRELQREGIDLTHLPELTPEEEASFNRRDMRQVVFQMLKERGYPTEAEPTSGGGDAPPEPADATVVTVKPGEP